MRAYSADMCEGVQRDCDAGATTRAAAANYDFSETWVRRLRQRRRESGEVGPRRRTALLPRVVDVHADRLRPLVVDCPDATLGELHTRLGVAVGLTAL